MSWAVPRKVNDGEFLRTKDYIKASLGYPMVSVPVSEFQLNIAIEDALERWYMYMSHGSQYMAVDTWMFQTTQGQSLYKIDDCIDPAKIRAVIYNPQNYSLFNIAFNQNFDFLFFTTQEQIPELTTFYFAMMKQEFVNKVLGQEGTWDIVGSPPMLQLMPTPKGSISVGVMFAKLPDESTLEKIGWIRRFSLAKTKLMLGETLSRYSSIPGAMGDLQLNGNDLKAEGKEEIEKMENELRLMTEAYHIQTDSETW